MFVYRNKMSVQEIYSQYVHFRKEPVPFPWESVVTWLLASYISETYSSQGDLLELGVENGGTAFLTLFTLGEYENLYLVDQRKTEIFQSVYNLLPESKAKQINFTAGKTNGLETDTLLCKQYRSIHIDAGHLYQEVLDDLNRYESCLRNDGMLIMDDVFQGRWPEVTEALYDFLKIGKSGLKPCIVASNKAYFCKADFHTKYLEAITDISADFLAIFGNFQVVQTKMAGEKCYFIRGTVDVDKRGKPL